MKKIFLLAAFLFVFSWSSAQLTHTSATGDLAGVWSLVAVENHHPDGSKSMPYGERPQGQLIFTPGGDYSIHILKAQRPRVAANDKNKATAEENAALVQGNNSHFGTYTINPQGKTITFHVVHAFYPNWEGTVQERTYTLTGDTLSYVVTNTTNGGAVKAVVVWKRQKG